MVYFSQEVTDIIKIIMNDDNLTMSPEYIQVFKYKIAELIGECLGLLRLRFFPLF